MSRRSQSAQPINLFAFLDILICTMGALILMLMVVTTRQLRKESLAQVLAEFKTQSPPVMSVESPLPPPPLIETTPEPEAISIPEPEPEPAEPKVDPREIQQAEREAALAQREKELNDLIAEWRQKSSTLQEERDRHASSLTQRRRLKEAAERQVASLQKEARDLEVKLGGLTGELTALATGDATLQERKLIEQQIAELQKRIKAAQAAAAGGESKYMVVPFDPHSGTARRPILIECTADGLRFIPEGVVIRPDDLEGFTPRVNPLLAGSNSLVSYWTAWNLKQPQPAREPEPYVLMLVRPSGTVAYYVAMRMLSTLQQPHGYELIEEDTQLQQPTLDPGAKAACEAAVNRLLAERDQIKKLSGNGLAKGSGVLGDAFRGGGGSGSKERGSSNRFEVSDVTDSEEEVGSRSWERIENFAGRNPRREGSTAAKSATGRSSGASSAMRPRSGAELGTETGEPRREPDVITADDVNVSPDRSFANGLRQGEGGQPANPTTSKGGRAGGDAAPQADTGIEQLIGSNDSTSPPGAGGTQPGRESPLLTGLGSSGNPSLRVEDRRTKNKSATGKSLEPEQLTRKRWGLSGPDAAIGLEREVYVEVESKRLVVAGKHAIRVGEGETVQQTLERLVTVLDMQARDWGQPPQGFYWKPSLRFVVARDANANYETAKSIADRAGLSSSKEFATDPKEIPPSPAPARTIPGSKP